MCKILVLILLSLYELILSNYEGMTEEWCLGKTREIKEMRMMNTNINSIMPFGDKNKKLKINENDTLIMKGKCDIVKLID